MVCGHLTLRSRHARVNRKLGALLLTAFALFSAERSFANTTYGPSVLQGFRLENIGHPRVVVNKHLTPEEQALFDNHLRQVLLKEADRVADQARADQNALLPHEDRIQSGVSTASTQAIGSSSVSKEEAYRNLTNPDYVVQSAPFILPVEPGENNFLKDLGSAMLGSAARLTANKTNIGADPLAASDPRLAQKQAIRGTFRTSDNDRVQVGCLVSMDESTLCIFRIRFGHIPPKTDDVPVYTGLSRGMR